VAFAVENALAAYSGTTAAPHEYFDHTASKPAQISHAVILAMDTEAMPVLPAPVKGNLNVLMELSDGGLAGNQQATPDDGADPGQYQAQLVNCSRQSKFGHHLRLPDLVYFLNAPGIECSPTVAFVVIRAINLYGDPAPWPVQRPARAAP